jgi:hypothetical protein
MPYVILLAAKRRPLGLLAPLKSRALVVCIHFIGTGHFVDGCLRWLQLSHKHPTSPLLFPRHRPTHQGPVYWLR